MPHVRSIRAVPDIDLDGARRADATVDEAHALEDRLQCVQFRVEVAVNEFDAGVPVGEVAGEADVGVSVDEPRASATGPA